MLPVKFSMPSGGVLPAVVKDALEKEEVGGEGRDAPTTATAGGLAAEPGSGEVDEGAKVVRS